MVGPTPEKRVPARVPPPAPPISTVLAPLPMRMPPEVRILAPVRVKTAGVPALKRKEFSVAPAQVAEVVTLILFAEVVKVSFV